MNNLFDNNGAIFSNDRMYRYALWRIWDDTKPKIMFVGLNPSTASEAKNDPTIRRVIQFATNWGYGGVYMMNLFAFVTAYPKELKQCKDPVGENNKYLIEITGKCDVILFCWGNFKEAKERSIDVSKLFNIAYCLGKNANGTPKHPLYIKGDTEPIIF